MDQLVVGALQEGGIDRHHRLEALAGQARRERDRVLLGDADVVVALREALLELDHARAFAHRRGDADQALVGRGHVAEPVPEHLGEGRLARHQRLHQPDRRVELAGAVVVDRIGLGELVTVALLGDDVEELRALELAQVLQGRDQGIQVVAVDRADVVEAELLEDRARDDHALGMFLEALGEFEQRRCVLQHVLRGVARGGVEPAAHQPRQMAVERADRRRDRHVVVVEHHQHVRMRDTAVVQGLERHPGAHRAVADDRHRLAVLAFQACGHGHAERGRDRGRRMGGAEAVVLALVAAREARDATELAQRRHAAAAAGQDLVRVGLVAHVPDQPVVGRVVDVVERDRQLDGAEVGRQVAAGLGDALDHEIAQFAGELLEFGARQLAHVGRAVDGLEDGMFHVAPDAASDGQWMGGGVGAISFRARRPCRPAG